MELTELIEQLTKKIEVIGNWFYVKFESTSTDIC